MKRGHLTKKKVPVRGKHGIYYAHRWVNPNKGNKKNRRPTKEEREWIMEEISDYIADIDSRREPGEYLGRKGKYERWEVDYGVLGVSDDKIYFEELSKEGKRPKRYYFRWEDFD